MLTQTRTSACETLTGMVDSVESNLRAKRRWSVRTYRVHCHIAKMNQSVGSQMARTTWAIKPQNKKSNRKSHGWQVSNNIQWHGTMLWHSADMIIGWHCHMCMEKLIVGRLLCSEYSQLTYSDKSVVKCSPSCSGHLNIYRVEHKHWADIESGNKTVFNSTANIMPFPEHPTKHSTSMTPNELPILHAPSHWWMHPYPSNYCTQLLNLIYQVRLIHIKKRQHYHNGVKSLTCYVPLVRGFLLYITEFCNGNAECYLLVSKSAI